MKIRFVLLASLLLLPLTSYCSPINLPVINPSTQGGKSALVDISSIPPNRVSKWKISCNYDVDFESQSAIAIVTPFLMSKAYYDITKYTTDWKPLRVENNLLLPNGQLHTFSFIYNQLGDMGAWHMSFIIASESDPAILTINRCNATFV